MASGAGRAARAAQRRSSWLAGAGRGASGQRGPSLNVSSIISERQLHVITTLNEPTKYYPKCRARTLVVVPWQRLSFVVARASLGIPSLKLGGMAHGRRTDASNHYEEPSFEDLLAFLNSASLVWPRCSLRRSPVVRFNAGQAPQMWRGSGSSGRNRRSPVVRFNAGQAPQIWRGSGSSGRKGHYPARTG